MTLEDEIQRLFVEGTTLERVGKTMITVRKESVVFTLAFHPNTFESFLSELIYCSDIIDEGIFSEYYHTLIELMK